MKIQELIHLLEQLNSQVSMSRKSQFPSILTVSHPLLSSLLSKYTSIVRVRVQAALENIKLFIQTVYTYRTSNLYQCHSGV